MTNREIKKRKRLLDGPDAVRMGAALTGGGFVAVALWPFILTFPSSEDVYSRCIGLTHGHLTHINRSTFPAQIFCETEGSPFAGALYPFWASVGMSSVLALLVFAGFYGVWMMARRDGRLDDRT